MKNALRTFFLITVVALALAQGMGWTDSTWLETAGVITGAGCVLLVVERSIWNFPIGIFSCGAYLVFFAEGRLFADAGLQVVFIVLNIVGWIAWARGKVVTKPVTRIGLTELTILAVMFPAVWLGLAELLKAVNGAAPVFDAFVTALSLAAQWMLNRRHVESWLAWIVVDQVSVLLYWSRGMHLTAGLYAVFLVMCVAGLIEWRRALDSRFAVDNAGRK